MFGGGLEAAYALFHDGGSEARELCRCFAGHPFGEGGAGGDGRGAAACEKTGFHDASVFKACGEPQHVAAGGVGDVYFHGRRRQFARVARIVKVVQQTLAVHSCFNYR